MKRSHFALQFAAERCQVGLGGHQRAGHLELRTIKVSVGTYRCGLCGAGSRVDFKSHGHGTNRVLRAVTVVEVGSEGHNARLGDVDVCGGSSVSPLYWTRHGVPRH